MNREVKVIQEYTQNYSTFEKTINGYLADGWILRGQLVASGNTLTMMLYKELY